MEDLSGKQFGTYRIVEPLGEGGMAAVFKAYQASMDRQVAIKVLPKQLAKDPRFVGRFTQEAMLLAKLQHPHILPVFDYGQSEGYTYLVMPLIKSGTLSDQFTGKPLPLKRIRTVISQVGDALDYAHSQGLVHRDIKPSNVLLDERGNCLLSDFGIARIIEGTAQFTSSGGIIGTPAYMSPEQGRGDKVDARTDIYSLGIMLYEMAVGRVPYQAETPVAVIFKHIQEPLPLPRKFNPDLPEAVEHVIFKALAKDPNDRYQTAGEMVAALQAAIPEDASQPLRVSPSVETVIKPTLPPTAREKEVANAPAVPQKKKGLPALAWAGIGLGALVLCLGLIVVIGLSVRQLGLLGGGTPTAVGTQPMWAAGGQPTHTATLPKTTVQPGGSTKVSLATQAFTATQPLPQETTALETPQVTQAVDLSSLPVISADNAGKVAKLTTISQFGIGAALFSPDGSLLAVGGTDVTLYDAKTLVKTSTLISNIGGFVTSMAFSPDSSVLAVYYTSGILVLNVNSSAQIFAVTTSPSGEGSMAFSPDGKVLAVCEGSTVKKYDATNGSELDTIAEPQGSARFVVYSPDGSLLASLDDREVVVWDQNGKLKYTVDFLSESSSLAFSPDGKLLAGGGYNNNITLWDAASGKQVGVLGGHTKPVYGVSFSPDGTLLASASDDLTIKIWTVSDRKEVATLKGHTNSVYYAKFSPDGKLLVSGERGASESIYVWGVKEGAAQGITPPAVILTPTPIALSSAAITSSNAGQLVTINTLKGFAVSKVRFSPDGNLLAIGVAGVDLYDAHSLQLLRSLKVQGFCEDLAFSPDGTKLLVANSQQIDIWDPATGASLQSFAGTGSSSHAIWSPDGKMVAAIVGQTIKLLDPNSGADLDTLISDSTPGAIAFSPDGSVLASSEYQTIKLWSMASHKVESSIAANASLRALIYSPDGSLLAGAADKNIILWSTASSKQTAVLSGHTGQVNDISFSPDGKMLASSSADITIRLWDVVAGKELVTLKGHTSSVVSVAFSPDGAMLASGEQNDMVRIWAVKEGSSQEMTSTPAAAVIPTSIPLSSLAITTGNANQVTTLQIINSSANACQFSPDGSMLACGYTNINIYDTNSFATLRSFNTQGFVNDIAFSPDGKQLAVANSDQIEIWDPATGAQVLTFSNTSSAKFIAYSPTGSMLAAIIGQTIKLLDPNSGNDLDTLLPGNNSSPQTIAFSPDGSVLASADYQAITLWNMATHQPQSSFQINTRGVTRLAYSPDGTKLAGATSDNTIILWDPASGKQMASLGGHTKQVTDIAFSPDGKLLASVSADLTVRLWDLASNSQLVMLKGHSTDETCVAFSPDGALLASADRGSAVRIWGIKP